MMHVGQDQRELARGVRAFSMVFFISPGFKFLLSLIFTLFLIIRFIQIINLNI
jgi:hypothetical protein